MQGPCIGYCKMCGISLSAQKRLLPDGMHCLRHYGEAIVRSNHGKEEIRKQSWSGINMPNPEMVTPAVDEEMHPAYLALTPRQRKAGIQSIFSCLKGIREKRRKR